MRDLSKDDLNTILIGATFLGSGGGGPKAIGQEIIDMIDKSGKPVRMVEPSEVGDDDWLAIAAGIGSPDAAKGFDASVVSLAYQDLSKTVGHPFKHVMAAEIGAGNSFMPIFVAHDQDMHVVDGAGASRAVPSITMNTFAAAGIDVAHIVLANHDASIGLDVGTAAAAASPLRAVIADPSGPFGQVAGIGLWAMPGKQMKAHIVPGTLTMALEMGNKIKGVSGQADIEKLAGDLGGKVLGVGRINPAESGEETAGGFDLGRVTVDLIDRNKLIILNKNENLIAWRSDSTSPVTIGPDLICYLTLKGVPFSNAGLITDEDIAVVALPADSYMQQGPIVQAFTDTLATMGYPGPYVPLSGL